MENLTESKKGGAGAFLRGALPLWFSAFGVRFLGLLYRIPLTRLLGEEGMGIFYAALTVIAMFSLVFTAGVPKGLGILIRRAAPDEGRRIFSVCYRLFLRIGLVLSILLGIGAFFMPHVIGVAGITLPLLLLTPTLFLGALGTVYRGVLFAGEGFRHVAISETAEAGCKIFFGLSFTIAGRMLGLGISALVSVSLGGVLLGAILSFVLLRRAARRGGLTEVVNVSGQARLRILRECAKMFLPICAGAGLVSACSVFDMFLYNRGLSFVGVPSAAATALWGNYAAICLPFYSVSQSIVNPYVNSCVPKLSGLYDERRPQTFRSEVSQAFLPLFAFLVPYMFGLCFFGKSVCAILFPTEYAEVSAIPLALLSPAVLLSGFVTLSGSALEIIGKSDRAFVSLAVGLSCKIPTELILLHLPRLSVYAVPIGTVAFWGGALAFSLGSLARHAGGNCFPLRRFLALLAAVGAPEYICFLFYLAWDRGRGGVLPASVSIMSFCILYAGALLLAFFCLKRKKYRHNIQN